MLIDEVDIALSGGNGGAGKISFGPRRDSGPDGGDGGRGGDLFIKVSSDLTLLNQFSRTKDVKAGNGQPGMSQLRSGSAGEDLVVVLPIGCELIDKKTGQVINLNRLDENILIAKGGKGGFGNDHFKSPTNTTPKYAQKGLEGQKREFKVNLKLIANFGLIGLPNAGKSSLLNELTNAKSKVGSYPFTTLEANLGVLDGKILADIPGLIEGASEGRGLGDRFLKHIEKVGLLIHCLSSESEDLEKDYQTIRTELEKYNPDLVNKEEILVLTKTDLLTPEVLEKKMKELGSLNKRVIGVSVYDWESLQRFKNYLKTAVPNGTL